MQEAMNEPFLPMTERIDTAEKRAPTQAITISAEWIAYAILLVVALMMRFAELDTVPLASNEAREALAAWRAVGVNTTGSALLPSSPLVFLVQSLSFGTLGINEGIARMVTALVGTGLVFSPLLFRQWLGRERAFLTALILLCSPVLLLASRESSPTIWAMGCAVLLIWVGARYFSVRNAAERMTTTGTLLLVLLAVLAFLTERGGVLLLLIGAGGLMIGGWLTRRSRQFTFEDEEMPNTDAPDNGIWAGVRALPWATGLPVAALIVLAVATGFLLYPVGLSGIGEVFSGLIAGFAERAPGGTVA